MGIGVAGAREAATTSQGQAVVLRQSRGLVHVAVLDRSCMALFQDPI